MEEPHEILFRHLEKKVNLTLDEKNTIKGFFTPKKLEKKQLLLKEGTSCTHLAFVTKGLLKAYNTDGRANEHINQFSPEGWWTSDMGSFFSGDPSFYSIDAIEDSEVLLIPSGDFEDLTIKVPSMDRYFRILFQKSLITKERRLVSSQTHTAIEKYRMVLEKSPEIIARVPQVLLASYLGITPETLSRLKRQLLFGK